jgi:hypothetical protein
MASAAWLNVLSHLPASEVVHARAVCREFALGALPAIQENLRRQETVTIALFDEWYLALFHHLILQNPAYAQEQTAHRVTRGELERHWQDHSVPLIYSYILSQCTSATEVDLTGSRFSIFTFLGQYHNYEAEAPTLDAEMSLERTTHSQIASLVDPLQPIFEAEGHRPLDLPNVKTLKIKPPDLTAEEAPEFWKRVAGIFPGVTALGIEGQDASEILATYFRGD